MAPQPNFFPRQSSEFVCLISCCCTHTKLLLHLAVDILYFANKQNIVGRLVCWNISKLMMKFGQLSTNVWIAKHRFMSAGHTSVYQGHHRFYLFSLYNLLFGPASCILFNRININCEFCFQVNDSGFPIFRTLRKNISEKCTILRSSVIMWPDGLYRNSED